MSLVFFQFGMKCNDPEIVHMGPKKEFHTDAASKSVHKPNGSGLKSVKILSEHFVIFPVKFDFF